MPTLLHGAGNLTLKGLATRAGLWGSMTSTQTSQGIIELVIASVLVPGSYPFDVCETIGVRIRGTLGD